MEKQYPIQILHFILSFLLISSLACQRKHEGSRTFKFDLSEGSYYVIPESSTENLDMSVVGCTSLKKASVMTVVFNQKPKIKEGAQCIIPYEETDCRAPKLDARSGVKVVRSFHLCSWGGLPYSNKAAQETSNEPEVILYEYSNFWAELIQYPSIGKECKNLDSNKDKKVSSVSLRLNCLHLFDHKDCNGDMYKLTRTNIASANLARIDWDKKVSSMKACGPGLKGKLIKFGVTSTLEDLNMEGELEKINITDPQTFVNDQNNPLYRNYQTLARSFQESLTFKGIKELNLFESIEVDDKISMNGDQCFPDNIQTECLSEEKMKEELRRAYQFHSEKESREKRMKELRIERSRNFNRESLIEVPACKTRVVSSFILVKNHLSIKFELGIRLSGEHRGEQMNAKELRDSLPQGVVHLGDLNKFEIFAKTSGNLVATLGVRLGRDVVTSTSPNCRNMPLSPITGDAQIPINSNGGRQPKIVWTTKDNSDNSSVTTHGQMGNQTGGGKVKSEEGGFNAIEFLQKYQIYFILLGILLFCILYVVLCVRVTHNEGLRENEIEIVNVGQFALTVEFHYPCCYNI